MCAACPCPAIARPTEKAKDARRCSTLNGDAEGAAVSHLQAASSRRQGLLAHALLSVVVLLMFARVVGFPFIAFDDAEFILRNPQVTTPLRSVVDLWMTPNVGYVVPVTVMTEAALYALSGGLPWSFHAAALLLHIVYASQLLAFARTLGARLSLAWAGALLFSLHPLVVQPVSWAICLKDLLMANLALGATRVFLHGARNSTRGLWIAMALALLAMLAKPSAALLGFVWLAYALMRARRDGEHQNRATACALLVSGLGVLVALGSRLAHDTFLNSDTPSAHAPTTPLAALGLQLQHVVWPSNLLIVYKDPGEHAAVGLIALGGLGLVLAVIVAFRMRRRPEHLLVLGFALALYLPTSNLLPFGRVISDSYMYAPLSGLMLFFVLWLQRVLSPRSTGALTLALGASFAIALLFAISTNAQLERWHGGRALWEPVVRAYPRLASARRLMGDELLFRGSPKLAADLYRRAFELDYDPRYLMQFGTILGMAGRIEDAECVLIEAVALGSDRGYALFNYAALLAFDPSYQSRQPVIAKQLLSELDARRRQGKLSWPPPLEAGLATQLERLRSQPDQALSWPKRNCAVLRAK
jgi:tetratricopeptide (TPR) repeat protein